MQHEFALFYEHLTHATSITLQDSELVQRIAHVLRAQVGQTLILFNRTHHGTYIISQITKKAIELSQTSYAPHQQYQPTITFLLPALKREALEESIYSLIELGATSIQLVITERVQRSWQGVKELERLQRIAIAAAEQSKNFSLPTIHAPISLQDALGMSQRHTHAMFFDAQGESMRPWLCSEHVADASYLVLIGPEADLSQAEKESVCHAGFVFYALTPTILRARQAVVVVVGILRTLG